MPRQPNKALSLDAFVNTAGPKRGVKPSDSEGESLFGKFVKARHLDSVDEMEAPSRPKELKRSLSASKLANLKQRQRASPAPSPAPSRPSSMRSMKCRPQSPAPSTSPVASRPSSMRSMKSRSRSPAIHKEDLATMSPKATASPSGTTPKLPRSPKSISQQVGRSKLKSRKSQFEAMESKGITPCLVLEDSLPLTIDDSDQIPGLVDDSVVREKIEGQRGGTHWNIMEDTPAGHAEEKLTIVSAIENDDQSSDWRNDESDCLEEDDDIIDDTDEHSLVIARARRRNSLPTDPSSAYDHTQVQGEPAKNDRFAPGFNNYHMWSGGAAFDTHLTAVQRSISVDASLLSDDLTSVGDVGDSRLQYGLQQNFVTPNGVISSGGAPETQPTVRQSGGKGIGKMHHAPNLDTDSSGKDTSIDSESRLEGRGPVDKNLRRKASVKKRTPSDIQPATENYEKKGSNSSGRSSQRRSTNKPRKERDALHNRKSRKLPDVVPTPMGHDIRSPSTLGSTPISVVSSHRSHSLPASRLRHPKNSPKQSAPRPLNLHVESCNECSQLADDDDTLGASTITTNFSTTQRTTSDKTVSTRSLFQSNTMNSSHTLRLPQRRSDPNNFDDSDPDGRKPPQQPRRSVDDDITESSDLPDSEITSDELFAPKVLVKKPISKKLESSSVLRRPSGDGDDLLEMIESSHVQDETESSEDASLEDSGTFGLKDQQKSENNNDDDHHSSQSNSASRKQHRQPYLQLNPVTPSIVLESEITTTLPSGMSALSKPIDFDDSARRGEAPEQGKDGVVPIVSERIDDETCTSAVSPGDVTKKKKKKKSMLGLFKRVASWKGAVPLDDEKEE